jgi:phosphoribosylaminoimidazole carboxylase (NCAIR synthetase)
MFHFEDAPINRCARHRFRKGLACQHCHTSQIARLRTNLRDAAKNHVVDHVGIDACAFRQFIQHHCTQISRLPLAKKTVLAAGGSTHCSDNVTGEKCETRRKPKKKKKKKKTKNKNLRVQRHF